MEELKALAEVMNAGGNTALIFCALYIYKSTQAYNRIADRLARFEAKAKIEPLDEQEK